MDDYDGFLISIFVWPIRVKTYISQKLLRTTVTTFQKWWAPAFFLFLLYFGRWVRVKLLIPMPTNESGSRKGRWPFLRNRLSAEILGNFLSFFLEFPGASNPYSFSLSWNPDIFSETPFYRYKAALVILILLYRADKSWILVILYLFVIDKCCSSL